MADRKYTGPQSRSCSWRWLLPWAEACRLPKGRVQAPTDVTLAVEPRVTVCMSHGCCCCWSTTVCDSRRALGDMGDSAAGRSRCAVRGGALGSGRRRPATVPAQALQVDGDEGPPDNAVSTTATECRRGCQALPPSGASCPGAWDSLSSAVPLDASGPLDETGPWSLTVCAAGRGTSAGRGVERRVRTSEPSALQSVWPSLLGLERLTGRNLRWRRLSM